MKKPFKHTDLDDKFSDFEYSPNDSVWNNISGGINSKRTAGVLASKFNQFEQKPSNDVWNNITATLHPQRSKRKIVFWWWSGAASVALLLGWMVLFNSNLNTVAVLEYNPKAASADNQKANENVVEILNDEENGAEVLDFNKNNGSSSGSVIQKQNHNNASAIEKIEETPQIKNTSSQNQVAQSSALITDVNEIVENHNTTYKVVYQDIRKGYLNEVVPEESKLKGKKLENFMPIIPVLKTEENSWELIAQNQLNTESSSSAEELDWVALDSATEESFSNSNIALADGSTEELSFIELQQEDFQTPIYFSILGDKKLFRKRTERASLLSGLGFLQMNSSLGESQIKRNYLAVPLEFKYKIVDRKRVDSYTTVGTGIEVGLSGKRTYFDTALTSSMAVISTDQKVGLGQANINLNWGVQIKLSEHLSVFTQAGASHYFFESQPTFWSIQKFWPNIKTGIVFTP